MTGPPARLLSDLPAPDPTAQADVADRASRVLRPRGALARLDEVACWLAGWQRTDRPCVDRPGAIVFLADHGVADEGVSAYPQSVSKEMLRALQQGVATASVLARDVGANLKIVDVGVGQPTGNLAREPALSLERFGECFESGCNAVRELECDILVVGEMGIGNTTAAAALCAVLFGGPARRWAGRGTGLDDEGLAHKIEVIEAARQRVGRVGDVSPFEAQRQVGGAELVAIAGAVLQARLSSIPVVLDGFVVTASVAPLKLVNDAALDHCIAGHCSAERGHRLLLEKMGQSPLIDLDLRLGEGSGALTALPVIRIAAAAVTEVATFDEWGIG